MDVVNVEIEVDELAKILFIDNVNDSNIYLSLGGIENNKDLFYFCLDIFCKGLVIMFGSSNRIDLESLTLEQFDEVKRKISNAGINVKLKVYEDIKDESETPVVNILHLENLSNNLPLHEYTFVIRTTQFTYEVGFELFHNAS